jgi:hypothetical protein
MPPRLLAFAAVLAAALAAAPAARAARVPEFTVTLPGDATTASVHADSHNWIVGAVAGRRAAAVAKRFGARRFGLAQIGNYLVPRARARAFAAALRSRHLLLYAQANTLRVRNDPLSGPPNAWRSFVVSPSINPPRVTKNSPLIALVDTPALPTHPEWTRDTHFATTGNGVPFDLHGTATAAVAAAPKNKIGILGVWPGARTLNVATGAPTGITCQQSADGIAAAIQRIVATPSPRNPHAPGVINMSYGAENSLCIPEYAELEVATALGIVPVAAVGNEAQKGSPLEFPASLPHVLTVGATGPDDTRTFFSNLSPAIDLAAPGIGIETAVPPAFDTDGTADGYSPESGTSFSAPMVSAAVAWIEQARPGLRADQVAQVVRRSARDVETRGWDVGSGFGVLDIDRALRKRAPAHDVLEPNENMFWVTALHERFVWRGRGRGRVAASVNPWEDPLDVYRIRIPAHRRARITAAPRVTGIRLLAFDHLATSVNDTAHQVASSQRPGRRTERVTLRNRSSRAQTFYVDVESHGVSLSRDIHYTLRFRR